MEEKHKHLMLKITAFLKEQEEFTPLDCIICLENLLATCVVTAEAEHNGELLESVIHNMKVIYKSSGESYQALKVLRTMGIVQE